MELIQFTVYENGTSVQKTQDISEVEECAALITSIHGGTSIELYDKVFEPSDEGVVPQSWPSTRKSVEKCLMIERDTGANEIADMTARELSRLMGGQRVLYAEVIPGRIPVDLNRPREAAITNVFTPSTHRVAIEKLLPIYDSLRGLIICARGKIAETGIFLDIHTMWPFELKKKTPYTEFPGGQPDEHMDRRNWQSKRSSSIVAGMDEEGAFVADETLVREIKAKLDEIQFSAEINSTADSISVVAASPMKEIIDSGLPGAAVDFCKHEFFGSGDPAEYAENPHEKTINIGMIVKVATALAKAMHERLK